MGTMIAASVAELGEVLDQIVCLSREKGAHLSLPPAAATLPILVPVRSGGSALESVLNTPVVAPAPMTVSVGNSEDELEVAPVTELEEQEIETNAVLWVDRRT